MAWDCATGNGQAARGIAKLFDRVIATDASSEQIAHATPVPNVEYRVAPAEASGLEARSVDLVTVAQALHWLNHARFYAEARRVAAKGAVIAVWCYGHCHAGPDVEALLREFEEGTVGAYWRPERKWVVDNYRTIPFPFEEVAPPPLELRVRWSFSQIGEYISSWSAVAGFRRERGEDPVPALLKRIAVHWGSPDRTRDVTWPLGLRVGRLG